MVTFSEFMEFIGCNFDIDISCYLYKLDLFKTITKLVFIIYPSTQKYRVKSCLHSTEITSAVVILGLNEY